jgi:biopolymer transport protein ExbD/biopolymer transport protein TolR
MAFNMNSGKRRTPEMNVTPLVDVVLVLLIIFMVITPLLMREFWTHLPKQEKKEVRQQSSNQEPLVLQVLAGDKVLVNKTEISLDQLPVKLRRMFAARNDHVLFVDIKDDANYGFAVKAMDRAREGGAVSIALLTKQLNQN